jgi:16S rRNA (uracil1498-N3)-methyltransferase
VNRFFITGLTTKESGGTLRLDGSNARHAKDVLRLEPGDRVIVCDGAGTDYLCEAETSGAGYLDLTVVSRTANQAEPIFKVHLFHSLMKSDKMELAAQKAVELGVCGIWPFQSEHSVARLGGGTTAKALRLQKIIESAAKQSGRGILPQCHAATDFNHAIINARSLAPWLKLAAHEKADVLLKERLKEGLENHKIGENIAVFIGPEGGFSDAEARMFEDNGIMTFSMGRRIMRAETAGIAALCCVLYELEG